MMARSTPTKPSRPARNLRSWKHTTGKREKPVVAQFNFMTIQRGVIPSGAAFQAERGISHTRNHRERSLSRLKCADFRDDAIVHRYDDRYPKLKLTHCRKTGGLVLVASLRQSLPWAKSRGF